MDINHLRSIVTVVSMLTFAGIVAWACKRDNRARFDDAAMLPFSDDSADDFADEPARHGEDA